MALLLGYLRVSHVGGRGKALRSPDEQRNEIDRWAGPNGHEVHYLEPELDRKGSDAGRRIFRQGIERVKTGEYSGLVVAYLSRYSSLAALVASLVTPILLWSLGQIALAALFAVLTLLLFYMHRENIKRLLAGKEGKIGQKA